MNPDESIDKRLLLSRAGLFNLLSGDDLDSLTRFAKHRRLAAREVLFHKSDPGNQMCLIVKGRVKLSTVSPEGREMMFGILEDGDFFGEMSLLDGGERSATATAVSATELLTIERRDFIPFLERHPRVAIKLLATLAGRLRRTDETFEDTFFLNLTSRLAKKFLALAEDYGESAGEGVRIGLELSQSEIGNLVCTSRESVNKQMRAWQDEGLIRCEGRRVTLLRPDALEDLAEATW